MNKPGLNFVIDVYVDVCYSAIAANTFLRSVFGGGFPIFAVAMSVFNFVFWLV
jgi:DHA1 family multidrug resistance protein-like MFS transporter